MDIKEAERKNMLKDKFYRTITNIMLATTLAFGTMTTVSAATNDYIIEDDICLNASVWDGGVSAWSSHSTHAGSVYMTAYGWAMISSGYIQYGGSKSAYRTTTLNLSSVPGGVYMAYGRGRGSYGGTIHYTDLILNHY